MTLAPQFSTRNFPAESSPSPGLSVPGVADVPQSRQRSSLLKHMTTFKVGLRSLTLFSLCPS